MFRRATLTFLELALFLLFLTAFVGCRAESVSDPTDAKPAPKKTIAQAINESNAMENTPLIPRDTLFGNPQRAQARLSPDGKWLSFVAPVEGVLNVWVAPVDDPSKAEAVTHEKDRPITSHSWAFDSKHILY